MSITSLLKIDFIYIVLGCPLSLTENVYWQEFFNIINPGFEPPSRHELSNKYLDNNYQEVKKRVDDKINSAISVGVQSDGWSNINGEGIINFVVTTPQPVFFKSLETKVSSQTGEYLADKMSEVI